MKYCYIITLIGLFSACNQSQHTIDDLSLKAQKVASSNLDESVRNSLSFTWEYHKRFPLNTRTYYLGKHRDEALKTLEIVEKIEVPSIKSTLVFYRYSIGTDIVRSADWYRQVDGKWYERNTYYSYDNIDPFGDGNPEDAKEILLKKNGWEQDNAKIWWLE